MNDIEVVKACAAAMEITDFANDGTPQVVTLFRGHLPNVEDYDPLHDDAQCFALVKRFGLSVFHTESGWSVGTGWGVEVPTVTDLNINYAICAAVAQLHGGRNGG